MKGKECCDSKLEQGCSGEAPETRAARFPLIGEEAPDFTAKTTTGWLSLSEYGKDSWVILFSHPADFTPVCTTELSGFAVRKAEFTKLNAKLLGLSVDSISAHLGWVQNVKQKTGVYFDFPIIADMKMEVAKMYGMIQGETSVAAVRAVFFIDPARKVRLIMYYPLNVGRNMDEILRCLKALQTVDQYSVATPLDWQPGDEVILHSPETLEGVERRMAGPQDGVVDFYLAKKKL
jgi:antioxidant, ahpC/TSA family protein